MSKDFMKSAGSGPYDSLGLRNRGDSGGLASCSELYGKRVRVFLRTGLRPCRQNLFGSSQFLLS